MTKDEAISAVQAAVGDLNDALAELPAFAVSASIEAVSVQAITDQHPRIVVGATFLHSVSFTPSDDEALSWREIEGIRY